MAPDGPSAALLRLTVASTRRRADVVVPGAVPVAEVLPELARRIGLLERDTIAGGHRLVTIEGVELTPDAGLTAQGVRDGDVLTVALVEAFPPVVYDDVVEATADAVERWHHPRHAAWARGVCLAGGSLLLAVGAVAAATQRGSVVAAAAAASTSLLLLTGALAPTRTGGKPATAAGLAWLAASLAAVAGGTVVEAGAPPGVRMAAAGGGALLIAALGLALLTGVRAHLVPPAIGGGAFLAAGLAARAGLADAAVVLPAAVGLLVLSGGAFPGLALALSGMPGRESVPSRSAPPAGGVVDPLPVAAAARSAHDLLLATWATEGLLLVLVGPFAVARGLPETCLMVSAGVAVALRSRRHRATVAALACLGPGLLGLVSVAAAAIWLQPGWRPVASVTLVGVGVATLGVALYSPATTLRRGRLGDAIEVACLVSLPPLLVVVTGIFSMVRR